MLAPTNLGEDAGTRTLTLKTLKGTLQGLVFAYTDFHSYPPPLKAT